MSDLKNLTVRTLRELAREHLGRGHSRLKTKDELVAALKQAVPQVIDKLLGRHPGSATAEAGDAQGIAAASGEHPEGRSNPSSRSGDAAAAPPEHARSAGEPKEVAEKPAILLPIREAGPIGSEKPATMLPVREVGPVAREAAAASEVPPIAEPLVEGFFVARIAGEAEAHRKHLVESEVPFREAIASVNGRGEESLGELPPAYENEEVVLLPRDPRTLYFFWDFHPSLAKGVAVGLPWARAVVKVFDEDRLVREREFSLEAKSFYLHDLTPGRTYRIECYVRGGDGRVGPLRVTSNAVRLPPEGPASDLEVRVMRVPWSAPLAPGATAAFPAGGHFGPVREGPMGSSLSWRGEAAGESGPSGAEFLEAERGPLPSSESIPVRGAPERIESPYLRAGMPSSHTARPQAPGWVETPRLDLPSSHSARGAAGGLESSHAPVIEAAPPDWARGPHLELPSSHSWRGAPEGLESSPGSKSGQR